MLTRGDDDSIRTTVYRCDGDDGDDAGWVVAQPLRGSWWVRLELWVRRFRCFCWLRRTR